MSDDKVMDEVKEVGTGLAETIKTRLGSPLIFSVLFSLVVANYRFFVVLFSEDSFKEKFSYIDNNVQIFYILPIAVGILMACIISISEIPYAALRGGCDYCIERIRLFFRRRKPMPSELQAKEFLRLEAEILLSKKEVSDMYEDLVRTKAESSKNAQYQSEMKVAAIKAYVVKGFSGDYYKLIHSLTKNWDVTKEDRENSLRHLSTLPQLESIVSYLNFALEKRKQASNTEVYLSENDLKNELNLNGSEFEFVLDLLGIFELISSGTIYRQSRRFLERYMDTNFDAVQTGLRDALALRQQEPGN